MGFFGEEHQVMVVHMHNGLANGNVGVEKLQDDWNWIWEKTKRFNSQVLMGVFNISLFRVILELSSRGGVIDLGACPPGSPWKGHP